jgi:hypothetical protein
VVPVFAFLAPDGFAAAWLRSKFAEGDGREKQGMKTLTVVAALLALLAWPAQAQMGGGMGGGKRGRGGDETKTEDKKKTQVDEKAYKDALKRIPEPKEKYDPWSGARPSTDQKTK